MRQDGDEIVGKLAITSGVELDRLVAKKVMGWNDAFIETFIGGTTFHWWSPSIRIDLAWQVVERMIELGYESFELNRCPSSHDWEIAWWKVIDGRCEEGIAWVRGKTAPLAICLAALRCLGVEGEV